jgi:hypothetical protein
MDGVMEQKKNKKKKYILRFAIAFALGFFLSDIFMIFGLIVGDKSAEDAFKFYKPVVFAETQISNAIKDSWSIKIPDDATNLYYALEGFLDWNYYIALTLTSQKQCEEFLEKQLKMPPDKFKKFEPSNQTFYPGYPSEWSEKYKSNWDLEDYKSTLFYYYHNTEEDSGGRVYYFPENYRIFIVIDFPYTFSRFHSKGRKL